MRDLQQQATENPAGYDCYFFIKRSTVHLSPIELIDVNFNSK